MLLPDMWGGSKRMPMSELMETVEAALKLGLIGMLLSAVGMALYWRDR